MWDHLYSAAGFCCINSGFLSNSATNNIASSPSLLTFVPLFYCCLIHQGLLCLHLFLKLRQIFWIPFSVSSPPPPVSSMMSPVRHTEWRPIMSLCLFQLTQWAVWGCDVSLVQGFSLPLQTSVCWIKEFLPGNASNCHEAKLRPLWVRSCDLESCYTPHHTSSQQWFFSISKA